MAVSLIGKLCVYSPIKSVECCICYSLFQTHIVSSSSCISLTGFFFPRLSTCISRRCFISLLRAPADSPRHRSDRLARTRRHGRRFRYSAVIVVRVATAEVCSVAKNTIAKSAFVFPSLTLRWTMNLGLGLLFSSRRKCGKEGFLNLSTSAPILQSSDHHSPTGLTAASIRRRVLSHTRNRTPPSATAPLPLRTTRSR